MADALVSYLTHPKCATGHTPRWHVQPRLGSNHLADVHPSCRNGYCAIAPGPCSDREHSNSIQDNVDPSQFVSTCAVSLVLDSHASVYSLEGLPFENEEFDFV